MKLGWKDFWIEIYLKKVIEDIRSKRQERKQKADCIATSIYTIALIDERFAETGYIIDYGKIKCSKEFILTIADLFSHLPPFALQGQRGITLSDLFIGESAGILIESTGELNGYESDIPALHDFDFIIDLDKLKIIEEKHPG